MFFYKLFSRFSTTISRTSLLSTQRIPQQQFHNFSNQFHSLIIPQSTNKLIPFQVDFLCPSINSSTPKFGFSSSASTETEDKKGNNVHNGDSINDDPAKTSEQAKEIDQPGQAKPADQTEESGGSISDSQSQTVKRRRGVKRTAFSDSDSESESDLSRDDLIKRVAEKEELLKLKQKEIEKIQDKFLRAYAEMENVMNRTQREAENSKKFAIQNFAKSLLDVADNLGRASSVVKESFSKIDTSSDSAEAVKLLKTLLEGVEMTEKQLSEVLKKFGVEKFDPTNEPFDPHRHNAVFQVPDDSKPPGTVAAVLKAGYLLHDRVIRPAEVGVTQAKEDNNPAE
ncbi:grpE protein homolog 2, mitochondrial-like [Trifolium pratense]|uniref:grpE protein homolog 2, mitochondrial-like n=1 Tax=Trifolium pratense TaxID=57577 RepID=UPI001E69309E|nr:grpE protein homolog 2, mitochondrial-like [Trifolium pratense]